MRPHGHARVDPTSPRAFAICDRCGFLWNRVALQYQHDYRGPKLQNLRLLVCDRCLDLPQHQLKPRILGLDPVPIKDPRVETTVTVTTNVTTTYSILATDQLVSCTGGSYTVTLPTAVTTVSSSVPPLTMGTMGKTITVQNNGDGTITIATTNSQTINMGVWKILLEDGISHLMLEDDVSFLIMEVPIPYILTSGSEIAFYSDGGNWRTI